jgi:hypothetical protein
MIECFHSSVRSSPDFNGSNLDYIFTVERFEEICRFYKLMGVENAPHAYRRMGLERMCFNLTMFLFPGESDEEVSPQKLVNARR